MINKIIFIVSCILGLSFQSIYACDVCGGGASNMGIGLMTDYKSDFIRMSYYNAHYTSFPNQDYKVTDRFNQVEISMRYSFGNRYKIAAQLPYSFNSREINNNSNTEIGLSDMRLTFHYSAINNEKTSENSKLYLEFGTGLNIPTGRFDANIHDKNLPENFNTGKGAIGYILQMNSVWSINSFGIAFSNNFQLNGNTKTEYHYGNQFNSQLTLFKDYNLNGFNLIPNVGVGYENISNDNYKNGNAVNGTGGDGLFLSASINIKKDNVMTGFVYSTPLSENYSGGLINAKHRLSAQISYLF